MCYSEVLLQVSDICIPSDNINTMEKRLKGAWKSVKHDVSLVMKLFADSLFLKNFYSPAWNRNISLLYMKKFFNTKSIYSTYMYIYSIYDIIYIFDIFDICIYSKYEYLPLKKSEKCNIQLLKYLWPWWCKGNFNQSQIQNSPEQLLSFFVSFILTYFNTFHIPYKLIKNVKHEFFLAVSFKHWFSFKLVCILLVIRLATLQLPIIFFHVFKKNSCFSVLWNCQKSTQFTQLWLDCWMLKTTPVVER